MRLSWTGFRFQIECSRIQGAGLKLAGFHFDGKCYWTGLTEVAIKYRQYADPQAEAKFAAADKQVSLSQQTDSTISIPCPRGLEYMGSQKSGAAYILPKRDVLLADEMGAGKSITVCAVINADPSIKKILVICPNSLQPNWQRELTKWLVRKLSGGYAETAGLPDTDIIIMNYEKVKKLRPEIDKRSWDLLVCDEAHKCKNPWSQRSKAVMGGEGIEPIKARRRLYLTGSPIMNRPIELWPIVKVCDPTGLGLQLQLFGKRYCAGELIGGDMDYSGASNLSELNHKLRSTFMIRRMKKDIMPELPPKRRQIIAIPNPGIRVVKEELDFYNNNSAVMEAAEDKAKLFQMRGDKESYKAAVKQLRSAQQVRFEQMAQLRYQTAIAMIPFAITYIEDKLEEVDKIIVFARHTDVVDAIAEKFKDISVWMHGGKTVPRRQEAVDEFQFNPKKRIIVGNYETMGEGWTLTAASYMLGVELEWVPSTVTQMEDRAHRKGQLESLLIQHLVFDNSLGCNMAKRIVEKQEIIDKAINGQEPSLFYGGRVDGV